MIKRSEVLGSGGSGGAALPVGFQAPLAADLTTVTMADGSEWLRTGSLLPAAGYPVASGLSSLEAHILPNRPTSALMGVANVKSVATNGTGTYIAVHGVAGGTTVSRSIDGGTTWTVVETGLGSKGAGINLQHALWDGNSFCVIGENSEVKLVSALSLTGAAGSWSTHIAPVTLSNGASEQAVNTLVAVWSGTRYFAVSSGSYPNVFVSGDGAAWTTSAALVGGLYSTSAVNGIAAQGGTVVISTNYAGHWVSADSGATFANVLPDALISGNTATVVMGNVGGKFVFGTLDGSIFTATSGAGPYTQVLPGGVVRAQQGFLSPTRSMLAVPANQYLLGGIYTTINGTDWKYRSVGGLAVNGGGYLKLAFGTNDMVAAWNAALAPNTGPTSLLGSPNAIGRLPLAKTNDLVVYTKVK